MRHPCIYIIIIISFHINGTRSPFTIHWWWWCCVLLCLMRTARTSHTHTFDIVVRYIQISVRIIVSTWTDRIGLCEYRVPHGTRQWREIRYDGTQMGFVVAKNKRKLCTCCSRLITQTVIDIWAPFVSLCMRLLQLPTEMMGLCTPKSPERTHTHTTHHTYSIQQTCSRYTILWMRNLLSTVDRFRFATI